MQKITIANVESKTGTGDKGAWTKTTITGADGLKASGFDSALANLKPGTVIEAEIEVKGKFTNIGKFSVISQGQPPATKSKPTTPNGKPTYGRSPEERASIERQTALKELGEMIRSGKLKDKEDSWLSTWEYLIAQMVAGPLVDPVSNSKKSAEDPLKTTADFHSPGDLANWWMKQGGLTWLDIQGALGIKAVTEIKDIPAAHATLAKIKAAREAVKEQK